MTIPILSYRHFGRDRLVVDLPKLIASKLLLQAASGGGKSWAVRQLAEQLFGQVPIIIIDPEGEFHTLREKHDFVLAAVRGGDVEASPKTAPILARRLIETRGSAVLDLSEMKPKDQRAFVRVFLETLIALPRDLWHPTIIVVDEAHIFGPEAGHGEAESLDAMSDFGTRARKRGFCFVCATTRIAKLHKDIVANLHNKLIGFNSLDVDIDRAAKELGFKADGKAMIRQLDPGSFYAYGPAISKEITLVRTGPVETTHPKPGMTVAVAAVPPSSKVKALIASALADLPKEAEEEARTIDELRRLNADLTRQLRAAAKTAPAPKEGWVNHATMVSQTNAAVSAARKEMAQEMVTLRRDAQYLVRFLQKRVPVVEAVLAEIATAAAGAKNWAYPPLEATKTGVVASSEKGQRPPATVPAKHSAGELGELRRQPARTSDGEALAPARQRILNAIADLNLLGLDRPSRGNVGAWVGISASGGSFRNNLGALRTSGLIDYPADDLVALTEAGRERAVTGEGPQSLAELHETWFRKLPPAKRTILQVVLGAYPDAISRDDLGGAIGVEPSGGSFRNNLGALRSLGLIDYPSDGMVEATSLMFPEGLS